jgi:hypothetical protein
MHQYAPICHIDGNLIQLQEIYLSENVVHTYVSLKHDPTKRMYAYTVLRKSDFLDTILMKTVTAIM